MPAPARWLQVSLTLDISTGSAEATIDSGPPVTMMLGVSSTNLAVLSASLGIDTARAGLEVDYDDITVVAP